MEWVLFWLVLSFVAGWIAEQSYIVWPPIAKITGPHAPDPSLR